MYNRMLLWKREYVGLLFEIGTYSGYWLLSIRHLCPPLLEESQFSSRGKT